MNRKRTTERSVNQGKGVLSTGVLYVRVSSKEQEKEGFSIPAQKKLLHEYALANFIAIAREFVDIETAKNSGRTAFGEMLAYLRQHAHTTKIILVEKTDRLYRNLKDWVALDELDVEIHFVKENVVISHKSRSSEKFMHGIKVLMAKNYCDNLSEETKKGMNEKAAQGIWPSCAPIGYTNILGPNGKRLIVPDTQRGPLVTIMFEMYSTGEYSLKQIEAWTRSAGLTFRKSGRAVNKSTVHVILRNRIYTGDFDWDGKAYSGTHVALVSRELWERVQDTMNCRFARRHRVLKHDFPFSGLIRCGHCGCAMVGEIKKGLYVYYHCTGQRGQRCPEKYVRQELLETRFTYLLKSISLPAGVLQLAREALKEIHTDESAFHKEAIMHLQSEYTRLQARLDAMYDDKLDCKISAEFFDRKATEWQKEQTRLLCCMEDHQNANKTYLDEGVNLLELVSNAHKLFELQLPHEKRRLLRFVLSNCTWKDGELQPTFKQPFDLLAHSGAAMKMPVGSVGLETGQNEEWLLR
jgi:DNA invertase Pin-like site-specific DNA recombinase